MNQKKQTSLSLENFLNKLLKNKELLKLLHDATNLGIKISFVDYEKKGNKNVSSE